MHKPMKKQTKCTLCSATYTEYAVCTAGGQAFLSEMHGVSRCKDCDNVAAEKTSKTYANERTGEFV